MRFIFIGDPHFQSSNIKEVDIFIDRLYKLCIDEKPDVIVIAGDILHDHERLNITPLNRAVTMINMLSNITMTYILVGNHDYINNQQFLTTNHWMNVLKNIKNVVIVDKVTPVVLDNELYVFVPYVYNGKFIEALNTLVDDTINDNIDIDNIDINNDNTNNTNNTNNDNIDWMDAKLIFAHQEFKGCKMGMIVSESGDSWPLENPYIISGHIHSKQTPQKNIYYPGSSLQIAFGESESNIIAVIDTNSNEIPYTLREIDLKLPRKKIVYMDIDDIEKFEYDNKNNDSIRITVSGTHEEFKTLKKSKKYKTLINDGFKIVFSPKKILKLDKKHNDHETKSFGLLLDELISAKNDKYLKSAYDAVMMSS
jgi:DNA repair exonuclease SbcCD nuclease subunit